MSIIFLGARLYSINQPDHRHLVQGWEESGGMIVEIEEGTGMMVVEVVGVGGKTLYRTSVRSKKVQRRQRRRNLRR